MLDIEKIKKEIVEALKPLDPDRIILFGSYAKNSYNENSDIDLYVVTSDEFVPRNWRENSDIYVKFSKNLREIRKRVSIDLIVHTKGMYKKFIDFNKPFANEILKGQVLWRKDLKLNG